MAFDIASVLQGVSVSDTGAERIEQIELHLIDQNPKNFYSMEGIDALADNIRTVGLLDPIRVKRTESGRFMVISGHRRRAALRLLATDPDVTEWDMHRRVACIVEPENAAVSGIDDPEKAEQARPLVEELKLMFANSDTRRMTSADTAFQVRRMRELLTELRDLGYPIRGKLRDHIAAATQVSATRVARLDVIDKGLTEPMLRKAWEDGKLGETSAYEIARRPEAVQKLAAQRLGPKILADLSTERVAAALDACEADLKDAREASRNLSDGLQRFSAASAPGMDTVQSYMDQRDEEDKILRGLCRDNLQSIMRSLMWSQRDYDFSENFRQPNIDRIRKHDPHSSYSTGWSGNGDGFWIDWDSKGIRVVKPGGAFKRTWTDFYDALTGAALQQAWKAEPEPQPQVSAADTEPKWSTGTPPEEGEYVIVCGIPKEKAQGSFMRSFQTWNGASWVDGRGVPLRLTVYQWFKLPEV